MSPETKPFLYADMLACLENRKVFTHVRYSDGEWKMMTGCKWGGRIPRVQGNDAQAGVQLGVDLRQTVQEPHAPPYYYSLPDIVRETPFLRHKMESLQLPEITWMQSLVLKDAADAGELADFIHLLSELRVCLVGPAYLAPLKFLTSAGHVETNFPGVYLQCDAILKQISNIQADVYVFSASAATNILIYKLWDGVRTMIDCGALWESYVNRYIPYRGGKPIKPCLSLDVMSKNLKGCDELLRSRLLKQIVSFEQHTPAFPLETPCV